MKKLPMKSLRNAVRDGDHEEQNSLIGQKVSIFDTIPATYGTVKGFTETEVVVQISAKKVRKVNPFDVEITLQFFQHDHDIMYDSGMDLSTSVSEDLAKRNIDRFNKATDGVSSESDTTSQVKEEIPVETKIEPSEVEKKPKASPKKFSLNLNDPEREEPPKKEKPKKKHFSFVKQKVGV